MVEDSLTQDTSPGLGGAGRVEIGPNLQLQERLHNWVLSPDLTRGEKNARRLISQAADRDLQRNEKGENIDGDEILLRIKKRTSALEDRMHLAGANSLSFERLDQTTLNTVVTEVRKDDNGEWVAVEKRKSDGTKIAEARISPNGETHLTLQYSENVYVRRNANPNIPDDTRLQEATVRSFNLLAGEVLKKHPKKELFRQRTNQISREIIQEIEGGKDAQGRAIYDAFKDSLTDPERSVGSAAAIYQSALDSKGKLETPGELNKLVSSLSSLHRKIGRDGYKPEVDVSEKLEGETDENVRKRIKREAIRDKVLSDLDEFPDIFASKGIESYARAKAKTLVREEELRLAIDRDHIERTPVRQAAYKLASARRGLLRTISRDASRLGNEPLARAVIPEVEGTWIQKYEAKPLETLEENERKNLVDSAKSGLRGVLSSEGKDDYVRYVDDLDEAESLTLFRTIADIDHVIANKRENLLSAINADPNKVCSIASEVSKLQLQRRIELTKVRVKLAEKRVSKANESWKKVREEMGSKIVRYGLGGIRDTASQIMPTREEQSEAKGNLLTERFKKVVEPVVGKISGTLSGTRETAVKFLREVDRRFIGRMRSIGGSLIERTRNIAASAGERIQRIPGDFERARTTLSKNLRVARHETDLWLREKQTDIFVRTRAWKLGAQSKIGGIVGGEAVRERYKRRADAIEKFSSADSQERVRKIRATENPYLRVFQEDIERRVKLITTVADTMTSSTPAETPVPEGETKALSELTNEELFDSIKNDGEAVNSGLPDKPDEEFKNLLNKHRTELYEAKGRLVPHVDYSEEPNSPFKSFEDRLTELDRLISQTKPEDISMLLGLLNDYRETLNLCKELADKTIGQTKS